MKQALIVVDYQFDFADPLGTLYINKAEDLFDGIISEIGRVKKMGGLVVFTQDYHPIDHISFKEWPAHCIVNTQGSDFIIDQDLSDLVIQKGIEKDQDSYSGFYISPNKPSFLKDYLIENEVEELLICGVALDVCVVATYNDAKKLGFKSKVLIDLTKRIDENYEFIE